MIPTGDYNSSVVDFVIAQGAGKLALREDRDLRASLHVQSISRWAPVCIGPYCQATGVSTRDGIFASLFILHTCCCCHQLYGLRFLAGQIGLFPATMELLGGGFEAELSQVRCSLCGFSLVSGITCSGKDPLVSGPCATQCEFAPFSLPSADGVRQQRL